MAERLPLTVRTPTKTAMVVSRSEVPADGCSADVVVADDVDVAPGAAAISPTRGKGSNTRQTYLRTKKSGTAEFGEG